MAWAVPAHAAPIGTAVPWSRGDKIGASVGGTTIALMLLGLSLQLMKYMHSRPAVVEQQNQDGPVDPQNMGATILQDMVVDPSSNRVETTAQGHATFGQLQP
jgi:hypothetical protein